MTGSMSTDGLEPNWWKDLYRDDDGSADVALPPFTTVALPPVRSDASHNAQSAAPVQNTTFGQSNVTTWAAPAPQIAQNRVASMCLLSC